MNFRLKKYVAVIAITIVTAIMVTSFSAFAASSGTHTPVTGVTVGVSGASDNSMTDGAITVTAKGSAGVFGIGANAKTATITIYNESGSTATVSFDWTATSVNQLVIDGTTYSGASGSFSKVMDSGASLTVTITTAKNGTVNKLVMSNFAVVAAKASSLVTFQHNSLGSITVDRTATASEATLEISKDGAALVATPASGATFLGWINEAGERLSSEASFTLKPADDMTVTAVFINNSSNAWFLVNDSHMFEDLNAANTSANGNGTIVLMNSGTLPAGDYTISSGVTLLIPYNADNTLCTTKPTITTTNGTTSASAYRTLTMASGAHITVNGAISVGGQQYCSRPIGAVSGKYGVIEMAAGSTITVEDKGNLYAWGYIAGIKGSDNTISEGTVTIKSGGTVYEDFQVVDWRGGSATTEMIDNSYKVFPMSQYYVQNVQVPMTLESGATENTFTSVNVTLIGTQEAPVTFIGTGGMFVLGNNTSVIKDYNEATDRLTLKIVEGSVSLGSVKMTLKISTLGGTKTINSANYVLPLNGNITIIANNGTTLSSNNSVAMLPGSELILEEGSNFNITSGSYYIYDLDEWKYDTTDKTIISTLDGNTYNNGGYCSEFNYVMMAAPYAHDRLKTRTVADLKDAVVQVNGTIMVSNGAYVYTTAGGANIYSTGSGKIEFKGAPNTSGKAYQAIATTSDRTGVSYLEVSITPAKLKNGDSTFVETSSITETTTYTYCADCMAWVCKVSTEHLSHATNVALGNSLVMYFAFWDSTNSIQVWDSYYVEITHTDADGNIVKRVTLSKKNDQWLTTIVNGASAWVVSYDGLAAKQMGDVITVKLYMDMGMDADGNAREDTLVDTWSNSIKNYAIRMLEDHRENEELRTLLVDMLNYGAACQKHFAAAQGKTIPDEDLANADLSAEQQTWATSSVAWSESMPSGSANFEANLVTDSNIRFAINGVNDTASYIFANHWGTERSGNLLYDADGKYYYISKLYVADAKQVISMTFNGTTWTDSIEAYCRRMIEADKDTNGVFDAFMKFSNSAKKYLEEGVRV